MPAYRWQQDDLLLSVQVSPQSTQTSFTDIHEDYIKIKLIAPPVDGKANQALTKFLAKQFKVSVSSVVIEKGMTSKAKRVRIKQPKHLPDFVKNP